jgi:transposase
MSLDTRSRPKVETLRSQGALNPHPEAVLDELFVTNDFFDPHDLVQVKYEMLRRVRVEGLSPMQAAKIFGFSRMSFYNIQAAFEEGSLSGLMPRRRGPRKPHKLTEEALTFIMERLSQDKSENAICLARALADRLGIKVHPRSIQRVLASTQKKR